MRQVHVNVITEEGQRHKDMLTKHEQAIKEANKQGYKQVRKLTSPEVKANLKDAAKRNKTTQSAIMRRALQAQAKLQELNSKKDK